MLEKMTPNQRLMIAVALSVVFFMGYTAVFPPEQVKLDEANSTKSVELKQDNHVQQKVPTQVEQEAGHTISSVDKIEELDSSIIATVKSENFILKIDTLGRIASKELLEDKFNNKDGEHAQLIPIEGTKPLYIRFLDSVTNNEAIKVPYVADLAELDVEGESKKITLTQKLSDLTVTKEITFFKDGHYEAKISLSKDKKFFVYLGQRPQISEQMMTLAGAMIYTDDEMTTIIEDGDAEGRKLFSAVEFISAFDQYSAILMYGFKKDTTIVVEKDSQDNPVVYFDAYSGIEFKGYVGQKNYKVLKNIQPVLVNAIEYGWFTFVSKPMFALLAWLNSIFGNWGWSIVALTFIVRAVLYPLTFKGMVSMQKMKDLAPKVKEVKDKYKGDPQRANVAVMDIYKKHGANPLGGCLPMILQIPVFFAIYRVLLNAVELQGAPWILWVNDLSRMDPTYVLPVLMGVSMYFQQRLTPNNFTDPLQEKIFKYLPVIFTFFFVTFPSGLVLYWFVNNIFSIIQQTIVNHKMKAVKEAHAKHSGNKDD